MSIEHAMNKKLQIHNSTAEFFILQEDSVCRKFRRTASDGKSYATKYYKFAIRGYVVDKKRFEKYRIIQDRLFQSDFDKYQTDNLLDFDNEIES